MIGGTVKSQWWFTKIWLFLPLTIVVGFIAYVYRRIATRYEKKPLITWAFCYLPRCFYGYDEISTEPRQCLNGQAVIGSSGAG